ncbi:MAG: SMI1/KNR4 family protein [Bermanella sp.]
MDVSEYNDLISSTLDSDFALFFTGDKCPDKEAIESFEVEIKCKLPSDFKVLISSYLNGFYAEAKEDVWPRKQGGAYWMLQYALIVYGLDSGLPDWMNLRNETKYFRRRTNTNLIPFMRTISSSEPYCFTQEGKIMKWDNGLQAAQPVTSTFFDVFKKELMEVQGFKKIAASGGI